MHTIRGWLTPSNRGELVDERGHHDRSITSPTHKGNSGVKGAAMLLRYSLGLEKSAKAVEDAVRKVLDSESSGGLGLRTKDLGGSVSTKELGDKIVEELGRLV